MCASYSHIHCFVFYFHTFGLHPWARILMQIKEFIRFLLKTKQYKTHKKWKKEGNKSARVNLMSFLRTAVSLCMFVIMYKWYTQIQSHARIRWWNDFCCATNTQIEYEMILMVWRQSKAKQTFWMGRKFQCNWSLNMESRAMLRSAMENLISSHRRHWMACRIFLKLDMNTSSKCINEGFYDVSY